MFRHDMSEFNGVLPNTDATYRSDRLDLAFDHPDWIPYLITSDDRPIGLAFIYGLGGSVRTINSFVVVRGVRRQGAGLRAACDLVNLHPGPWQVAFQDVNAGAARFWRRVATIVAGQDWTEERRAVPGRPDLPPDVWVSFGRIGPSPVSAIASERPSESSSP
ncbi:GNAT family N-acetyltransferase [Phytoactinopolyspora limicola]|uniref:GNAT family N-acetyltransferase n=1 Tax=Phytoactinopolyspora limicola TaxID=2715536 RepID=UPI0031B59487